MNNRQRNITLIYTTPVENQHLGKDVFLVPYYIGKIFNLKVKIIYAKSKTNKNLPSYFRDVVLTPKNTPEVLLEIYDLFYILFHAKKIDFFMRFFFSNTSAITGFLYKKLNKNGILYVKSDGRPGEWPLLGYYNSVHGKKHTPLLKIKKHIYKTFLENTDLITIETKTGYETFFKNNLLDIDMSKKVHLMSNGFDKELFDQYKINLKSFREKENIILIVGRLGTYPKNTEMVLEAAKQLCLNDWKIFLIGPIEKSEQDFQEKIDAFYAANHHLKESVIFTGPIYDKRELWTWYNNAKMFVLTSVYEGSAIVFTEALFFKNYIISTDVGIAKETIKMGYGEIIPQNDAIYLSKTLQKTIDDVKYLPELYDKVDWGKNDVSWERYIREATKNLRLNI